MKADTEKNCPFCREKIKPDALKCRFCGEFLPASAPPGEALSKPVNPFFHNGTVSHWVLLKPFSISLFWTLISLLFILFPLFLPQIKTNLGLNLNTRGASLLTAVVVAGGSALCLIFLVYFVIHWLRFKSRIVRVSPESIEIQSGFFSKNILRVELSSVEEVLLNQDGWQWFLGIGNLIILAGESPYQRLEINSLPHVREIINQLKIALPSAKKNKESLSKKETLPN
jgi:hypothetical protein